MRIDEFKAWLEGFEEAREGRAPTDSEWARIKEKLEEVVEPIQLAPIYPVSPVLPWTGPTIQPAPVLPYQPHTGDPCFVPFTVTC